MKPKCPCCNSTQFKQNLDDKSYTCRKCGYILDPNRKIEIRGFK